MDCSSSLSPHLKSISVLLCTSLTNNLNACTAEPNLCILMVGPKLLLYESRIHLNQKPKGHAPLFPLHLAPSLSLNSAHICTTSIISINFFPPPFFTVAETRRHHSRLLQPGKLSSINSPIHLQALRGRPQQQLQCPKLCFHSAYTKPPPPPPSTSSTPVTTPMLENLSPVSTPPAPTRRDPVSLCWILARKPWVDRRRWKGEKSAQRVDRSFQMAHQSTEHSL